MKGLLLVSGGIDSPVAGKTLIDRGVNLVGAHFHTQPFTDETSVEKSRKIAEMIGLEKLYIIPLGEQSSKIVKECNHEYYYVLTRRLMWRIAEEIAKRENCESLVTGENIGQVSSQTLDNLTVIDTAVDIPIIRPLLSNDKRDTVKQARKYGTYEVSKGPEMCNTLGPEHPVTRAENEKLEKEEQKIDIESMKTKALQEMQVEEIIEVEA